MGVVFGLTDEQIGKLRREGERSGRKPYQVLNDLVDGLESSERLEPPAVVRYGIKAVPNPKSETA